MLSLVKSHLENGTSKPVILTPQGTVLSEDERALYTAHKPIGFILFGRHCEAPIQVQKLCTDLRAAVGWHCPVMIDQEGGRVARFRAPHWPEFPAAAKLGDDTYQNYKDLGVMLAGDGVNMDCAPCLDVVGEGKKCDAIGDRCFSPDENEVGRLGIDACRGLIDSNVMPIMKHIPGHGRGEEDSHYFLPVVKASEEDLQTDLIPFKSVTAWDENANVCAMTAHLIYEVWDKEHPATLSTANYQVPVPREYLR